MSGDNVSYDPNAIIDDAEGELTINSLPPLSVEGCVYFPAVEVANLRTTYNSGLSVVTICLRLNLNGPSLGAFQAFTPDGARAFAAKLIESADEIDTTLANQANAAIDKARKSGGAQ
ncbi:MAG: hypothetical protein VYD90_10370 [Pseudomonadota bacterium]|nr:hypothetical protein [Pseudomonadota bacterium]